MSRPSFEVLISEHPESRDALLKLGKWLMSKARGDVITPRMLAREVPLDSKQLADALTLLAPLEYLTREQSFVAVPACA